MDLVTKDVNQALQNISDTSSNDQKKPNKIVLREEEYVSRIDEIIERDFFPDLERLRLRNEYQSALDANDLERLREVQIKWGQLIADEAIKESATDQESVEKSHQKLDEFLAKYTSEDNVSFEQIVEETRQKLRQKYWWLYEAQEEALKAIQVPGDSGQNAITGKEQSSLMLLNAWKYTPKNALMYNPDNVPLTSEEMAESQKGRPRINYLNTRLSRDHSKGIELLSQALLSAKKTQTVQGKIGIDGKPESSEQGYSFVSTPTPAPGVGESPLMTWGEIGATPMSLETPGPSFKIPETPAREELLFKLDSDNINKRKQSLKTQSSFTKLKAGKTPLTPSQRLKYLSPAARLLATKTGIATPTPLRSSNTPRLTPISTPGTNRSTRTPLLPSKDPTITDSSITDNLLKFVDK